MEKYNIPEVDQFLDSFSQYAEEINKKASSILANVSAGRVPTKEEMNSLISRVDCLQETYDSIVRFAKESIGGEAIPSDGLTVYEYAEAINEYMKNKINKKIDAASEILKQFISVRSCLEVYNTALEPDQKNASDLLGRLESNVFMNNDDSEIIEKSKLFLEAIATKDFGSESGLALLDKIANFYSRTVERGITTAQYFIEDQSEVVCIEDNVALNVTDASSNPEVTEQDQPAQEQPLKTVSCGEIYEFFRSNGFRYFNKNFVSFSVGDRDIPRTECGNWANVYAEIIKESVLNPQSRIRELIGRRFFDAIGITPNPDLQRKDVADKNYHLHTWHDVGDGLVIDTNRDNGYKFRSIVWLWENGYINPRIEFRFREN